MAIDDDPAEIAVRQAEKELAEESHVPDLLARLFTVGAAALFFKEHPFASAIVTTLLADSSQFFKERCTYVLNVFGERLKQNEDKINDKQHYYSDEFQSLFILLTERLHTTHDKEKLTMFGNALGNSGSSDFQADPQEDFIRMLRDMSLADLLELKTYAPHRYEALDKGQAFQARPKSTNPTGEKLNRASRLVGLGLLNETLSVEEQFDARRYPSQQQAIGAVSKFLRTPPVKSYQLSQFGSKFLRFIAGGEPGADS